MLFYAPFGYSLQVIILDTTNTFKQLQIQPWRCFLFWAALCLDLMDYCYFCWHILKTN